MRTILALTLALLLCAPCFGQASTPHCPARYTGVGSQSGGDIFHNFEPNGQHLPAATPHAVVLMPNGDYLVVGDFTHIGGTWQHPGTPCAHVARFRVSTQSWEPVGQGLPGIVWAVAIIPDGSIVVGGEFPGLIARWNGSAWATLGGGIDGSIVHGLMVLPNGDLVAGGLAGVRRWDGAVWHQMGTLGGRVRCFGFDVQGNLLAGGDEVLPNPGGAMSDGIARWTGSTWEKVGDGVTGRVNWIDIMDGDDLITGGNVDHSGMGVPLGSFAILADDDCWVPAGLGTQTPADATVVNYGLMDAAVPLPDGRVVVLGPYSFINGVPSLSGLTTLRCDPRMEWELQPSRGWWGHWGPWGFIRAGVLLPDGRVLAVGNLQVAVSANNAVAKHAFIVEFPKAADWNCSGTLGTDDIFDFLNDWLAQAPDADFDHSGALGVADIFDFLNAWMEGR